MSKKLIDKYIDYLQGDGKGKGTIAIYVKAVKQFISAVGKSNPYDTTEDDIQKFKTWCNTVGNKGKPYDKNTLIPKYSAVKIFLKEVLKKPEKWNKRLKTHPMEIKPKEILTEDEVRRLFSASKNDKRDNAIFKTLYFPAIRKGELQKLNIQDIDFENETITTWNSKGGHNDVRNIHSIAIQSIKEYLETKYIRPNPNKLQGESNEDYERRLEDIQKAVFLNKAGTRRLGVTDVNHRIKRYAVIAGIKKRIYPHLLRSSSATHMSNAGMSLVEIKAQTKHRSIDTLVKHYINPDKKRMKNVYTKAFNQFSDDNTLKSEIKQKQESQIKSNGMPKEDKTDKYIALLKDGLIDKGDFIKLISSENKQDNLAGYM